jgi:hypothetical protein
MGAAVGNRFRGFLRRERGRQRTPADNAPDREWIAAYTSHAKQIGHLATRILLVLAALSLMTLLVTLWTRVAQARRPASLNPLPLVAAGVAAACISIGGVLMAGISGAMLTGSAPLPSVELLRFGNDIGFGAVGLGGMLATALSVACLSLDAPRKCVLSASRDARMPF